MFYFIKFRKKEKSWYFFDFQSKIFFLPYFDGIEKHLRHDFFCSWISIYTAPTTSNPGLSQCPLFLAMFSFSRYAYIIPTNTVELQNILEKPWYIWCPCWCAKHVIYIRIPNSLLHIYIWRYLLNNAHIKQWMFSLNRKYLTSLKL